ncbi:hypothetical protein [Pantoea agglomerans]|uniref:hypothetical protein n=1 Tax=Enterobacter agglomerans TaxID=549 RepID=UPI0025431390|nr:hypothetical protein [Pantoea agglomerans]MDK4215920.1 hypothetical protein [Pantoea agglomerans]
MRVEVGKHLIREIQQLVNDEIIEVEQIDKVFCFIDHVKASGFAGLEGRNKDSSNVPAGARNRDSKVQKALAKKWWHYHIGINFYKTRKSYGDRTSEYVLHYANHGPYYIRVAKLDYHPPFLLPHEEYLDLR